jgi:hypothetical protein
MFPDSNHLQAFTSSLSNSLVIFSKRLLELVIDARWSSTTLKLILNEVDDTQRHKLINNWRENRLADLERINLIVGHSNETLASCRVFC